MMMMMRKIKMMLVMRKMMRMKMTINQNSVHITDIRYKQKWKSSYWQESVDKSKILKFLLAAANPSFKIRVSKC